MPIPRLASAGAALLVAATALPAQVLYVDAAVQTPGNGQSWASAFALLQPALAAAQRGTEIWVATGNYAGGFLVPDGVRLLGGFTPGDLRPTQREPLVRRSVLDGGGTQRVLELKGNALVDGFFVSNGTAAAPGGGGALVEGGSPTIRNCVFTGCRNTGGRGSTLYVRNGATPWVENSVFAFDQGNGHAVDVDAAGGTYTHIIVWGNKTNGFHFQLGATPRIFDSVFGRNGGRGLCHISPNDAPVLENNLIWANTVSLFHYRGVEYMTIAQVNGLAYAKDNLSADPMFTDPVKLDFTPMAGSPLVETGRNAFLLGQADLDLGGMPRRLDSDRDGATRPDIGVHEQGNVRLDVGGNPQPGGTLQLAFTGNPGWPAAILVGLQPASGLFLEPFGHLLVQPDASFLLLPVGTLPVQLSLPIPSVTPIGTQVVLQPLAGDGAAANLGNATDVRIR